MARTTTKMLNAPHAVELVKLKDNLYVPADFGANHHYYADALGKKPYTGVTTIISVLAKPDLISWAARMCLEHIIVNWDELLTAPAERRLEIFEEAKHAHAHKKEAAGAHGTDYHALVEAYINECIKKEAGEPLHLFGTEQYAAIEPFIEWATSEVHHFLFSERRMADPTRFVAGTADFAAVMRDGKRLIGDFKTSSGIYGIDYFLQCAAYKMLAEGEGDAPYDGCVIVRQGKKHANDFEVSYRYGDSKSDEEAFLACLTLYRQQATFTKRKRQT